jgi:hypothetical protein
VHSSYPSGSSLDPHNSVSKDVCQNNHTLHLLLLHSLTYEYLNILGISTAYRSNAHAPNQGPESRKRRVFRSCPTLHIRLELNIILSLISVISIRHPIACYRPYGSRIRSEVSPINAIGCRKSRRPEKKSDGLGYSSSPVSGSPSFAKCCPAIRPVYGV